ncbi:MAG: hypothetical protein VCD00_05195 [Candidatus Hydrogenedentota bacterium]
MEERPGLIISIMLVLLVLMFGGAFYFGQQDSETLAASTSQAPTKKFRAKSGTERENVRALVSSRPSAEESSSSKHIDVWGSLEQSTAERASTKTELVITEARWAESREDGVRLLLSRLQVSENADQRGLIYATLATLYPQLEPPMYDEAEKALRLAWKHASTPTEILETAHTQSAYDLSRGDFESVLKTRNRIAEEALPNSTRLLELGVMEGVAYEGVGKPDDARKAYESVLARGQAVALEQHPGAANVYRQAGLNLTTLLRKQGHDADADRVTLDVRRNLDF